MHGIGAELAETDLSDLADAERTSVIDAMVAGADLPMVLVGDEVVCTDGVDAPAVVAAAARISSRG